MENTSPHKRIEFILVLGHGLAVDVKMEVEIAADAEKVIFYVLNFFEFSEHLDILHLRSDKLVEAVNQLFTKLERKLVFTKISETLVKKPDV